MVMPSTQNNQSLTYGHEKNAPTLMGDWFTLEPSPPVTHTQSLGHVSILKLGELSKTQWLSL